MKHETISLIQKAIKSCGQEFGSLTLRSYLLRALEEANKLSKKQAKKQLTPLEQYAIDGQSSADRWWKMIQENVAKAVESSDAVINKEQTAAEKPNEL